MKNIKDLIIRTNSTEAIYFAGTFVLIFIAAKFGQYLFFEWRTSPAILWPPTGIAVGILWLGGYRYTLPIFLGLLSASLTGPASHLVPAVITTPLGQAAGIVFCVYLLRRFGFSETFSTMKHVLVFFAAITIACMVAPTITTAVSALTGNLTTAPYISWSRSWAGYIFSCLILIPLIVSWSKYNYRSFPRTYLEGISVAILLVLSVYFLFWTRIASSFSFLFFAFFFVTHFWVCLRFPVKILTLSMFVTTVVGILGLFISPNPSAPLNSQLFASELFLFLVIPIFYVFSTLVRDRANTIIELEEAMARIEKESMTKNNFIAVLAHELRNPLAPIKTTFEILSMQEHEDENKQLIASAHQQVYTMRRLLDDLLDITRVTQGKFKLQVERVSLHTMIQNSITMTKSVFSRNHTIETEDSCGDTVLLDVDPVRFEQSLVNVLNNAAKYTSVGGHIRVSCVVKKDFVEIRIRDNGFGIAKEHLEDIFKTFWQMNREASTFSARGIGVGLSLTRHIIEMHGGTIRAESDGEGHGSTFIITMPLARKDEPEVQKAPSSHAGKVVPLCRILVVDDNHVAADALVKLLSMKGHTAEAVYSGKDALGRVESFVPQVILLDVGLPDITGYEVTEKLRARGFKNKILAVSGYGLPEDRQKALDSGYDYHFIKPMAMARLEEYLLTHTIQNGAEAV